MKKIFAVACALLLCLCACSAFAEESADIAPLTGGEMAAWAEALRSACAGSEPVLDPHDEGAETEDGILFLYNGIALYADRAEMTEETRILAAESIDLDAAPLREVQSGMTPAELCAVFPNENPNMAGDRAGAVLYLREEADGRVLYGRVLRDGQRVSAAEYGELIPDGDGWRWAQMTFRFDMGLLDSVRAEGFSDAEDGLLLTAEDRDALLAELKRTEAMDEYTAVLTSRDGTAMAEFGEADLVFSGLDLTSLKPEDLPGAPEEDRMEDSDGSWLLLLDEAAWEAVFRCDDEAGANPRLISLTLKDGSVEGPRGVRVGDMLLEDTLRFRHEGRGTDENMTEILYGAADSVPRGVAEYGAEDGVALRYTAALSDGREAELLLRYGDLMDLGEIMIRIR